jgi:hypothetical protein
VPRAELPQIIEFVFEAPERHPAGRIADDEHPLIAHPNPLGLVELPCVEIVGGEDVSEFPSAWGAAAAWADRIGLPYQIRPGPRPAGDR